MVRLRGFYILFGLLFLLASACQEQPPRKQFQYLFAGHTYDWGRHGYMDPQFEKLDFSLVDGVWHGGDIISETTLELGFVKYVDRIIDLENPLTHIALGNHDARNGKRILNEFRNLDYSYYSSTANGLCFLILDTTLSPAECDHLDRQWQLIENVVDTISQSSHLIVLMHDGVWNRVPGLPDPDVYANGSQAYWNTNCQDAEQYFSNSMYPKFVEVEKRGVEVVCLMGDAGWKKGMAFESSDGIDFIASGINNTYKSKDKSYGTKKDRVVVFSHRPDDRKLDWEFVEIDDVDQYLQFNRSAGE